ncbi:glycosyltransferase family 2 protein [Cellulomonas aerilata]|uniref:Glycosyl transferase family 2 n=1 Tax=Cellulomonas aerilata TaxID=515326 RepID=A0A512DH33_9CELL|nr:glycosyltransferase family 2 protein [Cellulomonas aerilata]GEO35797.1 glycosyl transferase family 2 [Cellulomonas aerilata]
MPRDQRQRVLVVIPAWNEQDALPGVLREVAASDLGASVVVVNDGSTDDTTGVARAAGVDVLELPMNLGVGGAMRAGYRYARRYGFDVVVQLDADGQHDPREVPLLLEALDATGADLVIGARFAGRGDYAANGPRRWAMRALSVLLSRVTRTPLTDTTSGFKAAGPRAVALFATNYPAEYLGDTVESLVIAARAGLRVRQVSVEMRPRAAGQPSHGPLKAAVFLVRAMVALVMALLRPKAAPLGGGLT